MSDSDQAAIKKIKAELLEIIGDVLGEEIPSLPDETPILDFVLSSLALVEGMRRIYEHFGVLVSIRRVIEGQATLGGIAAFIEQEQAKQSRLTDPQETRQAPAPLGNADHYELAPSQEHIGFLFRYQENSSSSFNEAIALQLAGPLDALALQTAVDTVVRRYESLRTAFNEDDELSVTPERQVELEISSCRQEGINDQLSELSARPFQFGENLFRVNLLRIEPELHYFLLVSHGLVMDYEALHLVLAEIAMFFASYVRDEDPPEVFPAMQWTDYLAMQSAQVVQAVRKRDEVYWQEKITGELPLLELPLDNTRPALKRYTGSEVSLTLSDVEYSRLNELAGEAQVDLQEVFQAAFALYLSRISRQKDIILGVRSRPLYLDAVRPVVGQTRSMLPVRVRLDPAETFGDFVKRYRQQHEASEKHRNFSLSEMIRALGIQRDQSRSPVFSAAFISFSEPRVPGFGELSCSYNHIERRRATYDMELNLVARPDSVSLNCYFSDELFKAETIQRWLQGLLVLVSAGLEEPGELCGRLPLMTQLEFNKVVYEFNETDTDLPRNTTVLDAILQTIEKQPDALALRFEETSYSYEWLGNRIENIAKQLTSSGVVRGDRVGVLLERSPHLVAALLAVWRIGAQYVPMDRSFPEKRLQYMLDDADVACLLTGSEIARNLADLAGDKTLVLDEGEVERSQSIALNHGPTQTDPAIILYTSGSTGQPKGVQLRHGSLLNTLLTVGDELSCSPADVMMAITTVAFDISTMELFMPLMYGGVVDIVPDGVVVDGEQLIQMMSSHQPTIMQATPSIWKMILSAGWKGNPDLLVCAAGEHLERDLAEALLIRGRGLWNLYGPSETTVYSIMGEIKSAPGAAVKIGRPIRNTQIYLLDDQLQPVPVGVVGEIYIGGDGVAVGYWGQPGMTADRFVANPFGPEEVMYRTGDLGRCLENGDLLCLGRVDNQVKIHGVRIELGEIESKLRQISTVSDAVVTSWTDSAGNAQLVGHLIMKENANPQINEIRAKLRDSLPEVMIPPFMLVHKKFPMTANGKVKRRALPDPEELPRESDLFEAPITAVEKVLVEIFSRVLNVDAGLIGRDSDFLDLGGHSLLITPLLIEVRKRFNTRFSMREFFAGSTVKSLAQTIEERMQSSVDSSNGSITQGPVRSAAWGKQRMGFLAREAELPLSLAPSRGQIFEPSGDIKTILMTGATGFLGVYLIDEILRTSDVEIFCLVRPKRGEEERQRIENQMRFFQVWRQDPAWQEAWRERVKVVSGDVTLPRLGINDHVYDNLAGKVDVILHSAAHVNFIYPYESLRGTNVGGVHEIIRFAFFGRIKPVHYVSTAAIWPMGSEHTFYEKDPITHGKVLNLGYDEAKWVAEMTLLNAAERGLPVVRYRPGEVGGDSNTGQCVTDHFLIASIKGFLQFGAFPDLDMEVDIAPVDYVAKAIVHIMLKKQAYGRAFHLTNPGRMHMSEALDFLKSLGYQFETMPFGRLRDQLLRAPNFVENAMFAYQGMLQDFDEVSLQLPTYDTRDTSRLLKSSSIVCPPADGVLFGKYIEYLNQINFIPRPIHLGL